MAEKSTRERERPTVARVLGSDPDKVDLSQELSPETMLVACIGQLVTGPEYAVAAHRGYDRVKNLQAPGPTGSQTGTRPPAERRGML